MVTVAGWWCVQLGLPLYRALCGAYIGRNIDPYMTAGSNDGSDDLGPEKALALCTLANLQRGNDPVTGQPTCSGWQFLEPCLAGLAARQGFVVLGGDEVCTAECSNGRAVDGAASQVLPVGVVGGVAWLGFCEPMVWAAG